MLTEKLISVFVACYRDADNVSEMYRRLTEVLAQVTPHYEIIFVNDNSPDNAEEILLDITARDQRVTVISHSRNFGSQMAFTSGMRQSIGAAVILMDGDLQDAPEAIPRFVALYNQGYDVVYAQRVRGKEAWPLRLCYFVFYRMMSKLSDILLPLDSGDFGLISHRVIDQLRRMPEHHRYLRGLRSWVGFRQTGLLVERGERHSGSTKYGLLGLMKLAADGVFSFSIVPIRAAALLGAAVIVISLLYVFYALYAKLFLHISPQGFTALIVAITFLSGVLLFFLGVIGEYVGRIYEETKARPLYVIGRVAGGYKGRTGDAVAESNPERLLQREFRS